jgi:osmoprotectant transport system substrate-binding protein
MTIPKSRLVLLVLLVLSLIVGACGGDDEATTAGGGGGGGDGETTSTLDTSGQIQRNADNAKVTITVGSKNFTEQKVLGEIYAQGLEAAGYTVKTDLNLGDEKTALAAVKGGEIDAYPEYTGTALLSFFGVKSDKIPSDPQQAFEQAKAGFAKQDLVAFPPTPFTSSNEVAVTQDTANKLGLQKISDLSDKAGDLTLYGSPECRQRLDCLLGLQQIYGLKFKKFVPVDIARRHDVLTSGRADVSIVFTTDPQIQREKEVLLEDDKGMFPPYNSTLVMKQETADKLGPEFPKTLDMIQEQLTDENMQELNARVDLDKKDPAEVAKEYLTETGLIGGS